MSVLNNTTAKTSDTHNQLGCPYLNQSGAEAVLDWASVLAAIETAELTPELHSQLQQLRGMTATSARSN